MAKKRAPAELSKREKFERAGRFPLFKVSIIAVVVIVVAVGGFTAYWLSTSTPQAGGPMVVQNGPDYSDGPVAMTALSNVTAVAGNLNIPMADIKAKKIVGVVYERSTPMPAGFNNIAGNGLPLLAYIAPSGRLVVASSLCEPCRSYAFHIEGNDLVCNTCFTHWDLNTLKGKSGGCQAYPPMELKSVVQGDSVSVPIDQLESWLPRT